MLELRIRISSNYARPILGNRVWKPRVLNPLSRSTLPPGTKRRSSLSLSLSLSLSFSLFPWLVSGGRLRAFTGNHVHELISPVHAWWRPTSNRDAQKRAEKSLCPLSFCFLRSTTDKVFLFYREKWKKKKGEIIVIRDIFFFFHRYFRRRKLSIICRIKRISNGGQKTTLSLSLSLVHPRARSLRLLVRTQR